MLDRRRLVIVYCAPASGDAEMVRSDATIGNESIRLDDRRARIAWDPPYPSRSLSFGGHHPRVISVQRRTRASGAASHSEPVPMRPGLREYPLTFGHVPLIEKLMVSPSLGGNLRANAEPETDAHAGAGETRA